MYIHCEHLLLKYQSTVYFHFLPHLPTSKQARYSVEQHDHSNGIGSTTSQSKNTSRDEILCQSIHLPGQVKAPHGYQ